MLAPGCVQPEQHPLSLWYNLLHSGTVPCLARHLALPGTAQVKPSRQGSAVLAGKATSPYIHTARPKIGTVQLSASAGLTDHPATPEQPSPTSQRAQSEQRHDFSKVFKPHCPAKVMLVTDRHSVVLLNISSQPQATSNATRAYQGLREEI